MSDEPLTGVERIGMERARQVDEEGYTPEHDRLHDQGSMTKAAHAYVSAAIWAQSDRLSVEVSTLSPFYSWPWDAGSWKPSDDPIRNLEKAGALIAAEIDRLNEQAG